MLGLLILARFAIASQITTAPAQEGRVIVRLVSQHDQISILATSKGVRYSANDSHGKPITTNVSFAELKSQHPELSRRVEQGICTSSDAMPVISADCE